MLLAIAFLIRLGVRLAFGEDYFWTTGYGFYYQLAESALAGKGFCLGTTVRGGRHYTHYFLHYRSRQVKTICLSSCHKR